MTLDIATLAEAYRSGETTPVDVIQSLIPRLDQDRAVWISRFPDDVLLKTATDLMDRKGDGLPLYGIPFAVKDNIDVLGLPTTAACPAFSYHPETNAFVVRRLLDAGAICIGKTNLDQFATGLVGVRSPYGIPKNSFHPDYIPGGSSAGSAVAVASGLVSFSLGTDTAGSGRVPAAFNNLIGCKPTRGLLSNSGVVPACRSLDCISIFTTTAADAQAVLDVAAGFDFSDPFCRESEPVAQRPIRSIGVPRADQLEFFGDAGYEACWREAVESLRGEGFRIVEIDFSPFRDAAKLLYEGPWVAERYLATRELLDVSPEAFQPVTRKIIEGGKSGSAADAFSAQYRLAELRRASEVVWSEVDAICTPTAGTIYRIDEVLADPLTLNSNLGYYTNFMNLLDLAGVAVPAGFREDGMPFGITFVAPAFQDAALLALAGGTEVKNERFLLVVCGAHMSGLPLNAQLTSLGGELVRKAATAPVYRMVALDDKRPGMLRAHEGGASLDVEVWSLPHEAVGEFLEGIPSPLGLGRVHLDDGSDVCGFLCEAVAVDGKVHITEFGGWRQFLEAKAGEQWE
jgi:allophanate hydrolase